MAFFIFVLQISMKHILILFLFSKSLLSFSQSGFLGSKYNVNIQWNVVPLIFAKQGRFTNNGSSFKYGSRNFNASYLLGINRVINDDLQVGISYKHTPLNFFNTHNTTSTTAGALSHANYQSITFNFRKFKQGISPVGKQWGLNFEIGTSDISKSQLRTGELNKDSQQSGLLNIKWDIKPNTLETIAYPFPHRVSTFIFKYYYGRTIPIHKKLAIDLSLTIPLLRIFRTQDRFIAGFQIFNSNFDYNELGMELIEEIGYTTYYENNLPLVFSILKHNDLSLNIGLRYFI